MDRRTTTADRVAESRPRTSHVPRRPPIALQRRLGLYLGVAAAGALMANVVVGTAPAAPSEAATPESVSVARQLGLTARSGSVDVRRELEPLEQLATSRSERDAARVEAQEAQADADRAALERQKAEEAARARAQAEAKARAEAKATARAEAKATAAAGAAAADTGADSQPDDAAPAIPATAGDALAQLSNTAGPAHPQTQAAANAVVSNVPGADGITIGGTRPSATDPGGHPSGLALDWMVLSDTSLGDAIVQYHVANWDALGVEYLIYQQRMLSSPGGSWSYMEDRGSVTQNHMDHVHVNYRG